MHKTTPPEVNAEGGVVVSAPATSVLPEVRLVSPGATLCLCTCGKSADLPDCNAACEQALLLLVEREQRLLLCRCGHSQTLPYCDGSHSPPAPSLKAKWQRFWAGL